MKKLLSILLAVLLSLGMCFSVSSCAIFVGIGSEKEGFVKQKYLREAGLSGLSKPDFIYLKSGGSCIWGEIEREEFDRYVQEVFTYLTEKYEYVGIRGKEYGTFFGGAGDYRYVECEKVLSSYAFPSNSEKGQSYEFVFFRNKPEIGAETTDVVSLDWFATSYKLGETDKYYNFRMYFKNFDGLKDSFRYTNYVDYESLSGTYTNEWSGEKEYPRVIVARSQEEWETYQEEYWYHDYYAWSDFAKKYFIVVIQLPTANSAEYYWATYDAVTMENGKCVFRVNRYTREEAGADVMGECTMVFQVENYEKIYSPDDVIVEVL